MLLFSHEVFFEVAKQLSFSKAADILFISQPAISRHIKLLEQQYHLSLFERKGNSIQLTEEGTLLYSHIKKAKELQRQLEFDITTFSNKQQAKGSLVIGASTTVALYVIPKILSVFHQKYPEISLRLVNRNSESILKALLEHEIDFGIMEGKGKITSAKYKFFITDEVVPVCSSKSPLAKRKKIEPKELIDLPIALRERGSGTLTAVTDGLEKLKIRIGDLNNKIILGGTEALKNFLLDDTSLGFLPLRSVAKQLKTGELTRLNIPGLSITREFYFVQRQGSQNDKINNLFIKLALQHYNKKL
ncbi:MAG TPA: LysR substrate-binding domain-containing protein [Chitinophagaceae bacterium]|nr:LysR substrate-binding domain-containing protein [Chitinophagaceae bacterium]